MVDFVIQPTRTRAIVEEDGTMSQEFGVWTQTINNQSTIVGAGSPEDEVEAPITAEYMDTAGTTGNIKYIKQKTDIGGDKTKGWILI